ncbi:HAD hydrolase family protein [candidate division KSB1 bacterium]|nr:HAD hydrolase family protein [candidate division KSB1 bacterium]
MLTIEIPGTGILELEHLVLDYNGTLAVDGKLIAGIAEKLRHLARNLHIHIITADTFGSVQKEIVEIQCQLIIIPLEKQDFTKLNFVKQLNPATVVAIGNGRNDALMLHAASLGIALLQAEGLAREALLAADILCPDISTALDILLNPLRLKATLRI